MHLPGAHFLRSKYRRIEQKKATGLFFVYMYQIHECAHVFTSLYTETEKKTFSKMAWILQRNTYD